MRLRGFLLFAYMSFTYMSLHAQDQFLRKGIDEMDLFREFLAIANDANDLDDIQLNVDWCIKHLEQRGFDTEVWVTETRPLLFAEYSADGRMDVPTVLFYFHADGQSVDPQFWYQADPYDPVLKREVEGEGWVETDWAALSVEDFDPELRIFARSSSDSKCNIMMLLLALDLMKENNESLPYHLKLILDFEEEKGSPSLPQAVIDHQEALSCDMLVIYDGPKHTTNQPTLSFGARGIATVSLTVYGPVFPQHSGHYGNYAPNPAMRLAQLLASMKDDQGRVVIPGYYDGIEINEEVAAILAAVPDDEQTIQAKLGVADIDSVGSYYQEALQYPSLNVRGLSAGWVGAEARTIVPSQAVAEIDIRLVKETPPARMRRLIEDHIRAQGYHIVTDKPTQRERQMYPRICRVNGRPGYDAFRTDFDSEIGLWLTGALTDAFGQTPVRNRTMGGSIPISPFVKTLEVPAVVVPMANKDNNQHSPNENLRLGNYIDGLKTMYYILTTPVME